MTQNIKPINSVSSRPPTKLHGIQTAASAPSECKCAAERLTLIGKHVPCFARNVDTNESRACTWLNKEANNRIMVKITIELYIYKKNYGSSLPESTLICTPATPDLSAVTPAPP